MVGRKWYGVGVGAGDGVQVLAWVNGWGETVRELDACHEDSLQFLLGQVDLQVVCAN